METFLHWLVTCWSSSSNVLAQVPKEVWAALIAAAIAGYTATKSNKNARLMIQTQIEDAAQQAESKRKMDLRRDVYFGAAKAVTEITSITGALTDVNTSNEKIRDAYSKAIADIAGVHIVASAKTLNAVAEMSHAISKLYLEISLARAKLFMETEKLKALSSIEATEIQNGTALNEMMKQHNLSGGTPDQWERIQQQWEIHQKILTGQAQKRTEQQKIVLKLSSDMLKQYCEGAGQILPLQASALIAIREELGLPMDENEYLKFIDRSRQATKEATVKGIDFLANISVQ
uniref:hypothetical protein n=1 Tax=Burkholderia anthina TaxID=179879 RepID=UPI00158C82A3|nr:hypothetical protein [Burkholderia anthina]